VSRLVAFMIVCFALGLVLMIAFELVLPGILFLFAFIVAGVFTIAAPERLDEP
jgi:hypothetical protein